MRSVGRRGLLDHSFESDPRITGLLAAAQSALELRLQAAQSVMEDDLQAAQSVMEDDLQAAQSVMEDDLQAAQSVMMDDFQAAKTASELVAQSANHQLPSQSIVVILSHNK
jgi:hypothetical protein